MRRVLILSALVGGTALGGLGCKNATRGRCDCLYDPANAQLAAPSNPYPTVGAPVSSNPPAAMPAPGASAGVTGTMTVKPTTPAPMPLPMAK